MHAQTLTFAEQRVLGCLIEKRWTTPDGYPLSLNALRLACNQSTNRDPVVDLDEPTVRGAAQRLCQYGLARLASGHTSRSIKYRHLAEEGLGLDRPALAVLAVLLLRGPQTPGELKGRSERMAPTTLAEVERVLEALIELGYVRRLDRRPGQKEERYAQVLGDASQSETPVQQRAQRAVHPASAPAAAPDTSGTPSSLAERVAALEAEVAALRAELRSGVPGQPGT